MTTKELAEALASADIPDNDFDMEEAVDHALETLDWGWLAPERIARLRKVMHGLYKTGVDRGTDRGPASRAGAFMRGLERSSEAAANLIAETTLQWQAASVREKADLVLIGLAHAIRAGKHLEKKDAGECQ